jgi:hypothetical protein
MRTVVGLFDSTGQAESVVNDLIKAGIARQDISIISRDSSKKIPPVTKSSADAPDLLPSEKLDTEVGSDVAIGAMFGGLGGLLLGFAALAIPGIGPIVAAGPLAGALAGAGIGAAGGAIVGVLKEAGVPEYEAHVFAEGVRRGATLVSVRCDDTLADTAAQILDSHGAVDVEERTGQYRQAGWNRFDETASPYSGAENVQPAPMSVGSMGATVTETKEQNRRVRTYSTKPDA